MIKIFLKHLIYEKCIDVILNQIVLNFSDVKVEVKEESIEDFLGLKRKRDVEQFLRNFPAIYQSIGKCTLIPNQINFINVPPKND